VKVGVSRELHEFMIKRGWLLFFWQQNFVPPLF